MEERTLLLASSLGIKADLLKCNDFTFFLNEIHFYVSLYYFLKMSIRNEKECLAITEF